MGFLHIKNSGHNSIEIEVQSADQIIKVYLAPGKTQQINPGHLLILRSAEGGALKLTLQNLSDFLRLDLYHVGATATKRQRTLMPKRARRLALAEDDRMILLPVGTFQD